MPEGPEVKVFADSLNRVFAGKYLLSFQPQPFAHFRNLEDVPIPLLLKRVYARGKKIVFEFESGYLLSSLGMEGSWYLGVDRPSTLLSSLWGSRYGNEHFIIEEILSYCDTRHFGWLEWFRTSSDLEARLDLGVDLLDQPTFQQFHDKIIRRKKSRIAEVLLDQKVVAGIGNWARAEILYASKIHPFEEVQDLTPTQLQRIYDCAVDILNRAYQGRGASIRTYRDLFGNKGNFQVQIYHQQQDSLGNVVQSLSDRTSRTIWFVPEIQKHSKGQSFSK